MLTYVLVGVAIAVISCTATVFTRDPEILIERQRVLAAPSSVVFGIVNNTRAWLWWSPFEDPQQMLSREELDARNAVLGVYGQVTFDIQSPAPAEGAMRCLIKFAGEQLCPYPLYFTMQRSAEKTIVSWSMRGRLTFAQRALALFNEPEIPWIRKFDMSLQRLDWLANVYLEGNAAKESQQGQA